MNPPTSRHDKGDPTPCTCPCHGNPAITHFAACCTPCETCRQLFSAGLEKHRKTHETR